MIGTIVAAELQLFLNFCAESVDLIGMISKTAPVLLLSRILEAAHFRHTVIAHNLANINTPNYRRLEVPFSLEGRGGSSPSGWAVPPVVPTEGAVAREDGNTVDIEAEIGVLHRNALLTAAATQLLAQQLSQWRSAIMGRSS